MRAFLAIAFALSTLALVAASCASTPDPNRPTFIFTPDFTEFKNGGVNDLLARRCGTLDCHGQVGRPLRIYSQTGLRILSDASNVPGGKALTDDEITANFQSVVGLEPEHMSQVVADPTGNQPQYLLLIGKPRNLIVHKGGQVITAGDSADACLVTWVEAPAVKAGTMGGTGADGFNMAACQDALMVP